MNFAGKSLHVTATGVVAMVVTTLPRRAADGRAT